MAYDCLWSGCWLEYPEQVALRLHKFRVARCLYFQLCVTEVKCYCVLAENEFPSSSISGTYNASHSFLLIFVVHFFIWIVYNNTNVRNSCRVVPGLASNSLEAAYGGQDRGPLPQKQPHTFFSWLVGFGWGQSNEHRKGIILKDFSGGPSWLSSLWI